MVVPPKHPKMIVFSRKPPWLFGTTILGNTHMWSHSQSTECNQATWNTWPQANLETLPSPIDRQKGVLYVLLQKMLLSFKPGGDPFTFLVKVGTYTSLSPRIACFSFGPQNSGLAGIIIICQAYDAILLAPQLKIQATKISRRFVPKSHAEWSGALYSSHFNHNMSISDRNRHIQTMCIYVACQFCVFCGRQKKQTSFWRKQTTFETPIY